MLQSYAISAKTPNRPYPTLSTTLSCTLNPSSSTDHLWRSQIYRLAPLCSALKFAFSEHVFVEIFFRHPRRQGRGFLFLLCSLGCGRNPLWLGFTDQDGCSLKGLKFTFRPSVILTPSARTHDGCSVETSAKTGGMTTPKSGARVS